MKKRMLSSILCVCLAMGLLSNVARAETAKESSAKFDAFGFDTSVPSTFDPESEKNPYGTKKGQAFSIMPVNEVVVATSTLKDEGLDPVSYYMNNHDYYKNTATVPAKPTGWAGYTAMTSLPRWFAFAKSVAFDPYGDGQKNWVAYVGVQQVWDEGEKKNVKVPAMVVQNTVDGTRTEPFRLPRTGGYMFDKQVEDWEWGNFLSITAGDYDGDGKDTIVVYAYPDDVGNRSAVIEYQYDGGFTQIGGQYLSHSNNGVAAAEAEIQAVGQNGNYQDIKYLLPIVSLDTADIDRDGKDDLVTAVGFGTIEKGAGNDILQGAGDRDTCVAVYTRGGGIISENFYLFANQTGNGGTSI